MIEEVEALIVGAIAFAASYGAYLLIGLMSAPFIAYKREKEKGNFFDKRFVYHEPQHVFTTIIKPNDHGKMIKFTVKDAEPNSMVCFDFRYRGGQGYVQNINEAERARATQTSLRINKRREATLRCFTAPNSDDTQLRIYMLSWEY